MVSHRKVIVCLGLVLLLIGSISATAYASSVQNPTSIATPGTAAPTVGAAETPTATTIASGGTTPTVTPGATPTVTGAAASPGCNTTSTLMTGSTTNMMVNVDPQTAKGATARTYLLYVPVTYQSQKPLPLLLAFHGFGEDAKAIESYSKFSQLADTIPFIAVYPQGLHNKNGQTFWDSNSPSAEGIDEVAFVGKVLDDVEQKLCVDTTRIYAAGFSNGSRTAGMLACRLSDRIAAIATLAGNFFDNEQGCNPTRPIAIINEHGTADTSVPYNGGKYDVPGVQTWLQQWAKRDQCSRSVVLSQNSEGTVTEWMNCNGGVNIVHYRVEGEEHVWPKELNNAPPEMTIWDFLSHYALPTA